MPKMTMSAVIVMGSGLEGASMVRAQGGDGESEDWDMLMTVPLTSLSLPDWKREGKDAGPGKSDLKAHHGQANR